MTTLYQTQRLAEIRSQLQMHSAQIDTSTWEATFFLALLEEKNKEIKALRKILAKRIQRPRVK